MKRSWPLVAALVLFGCPDEKEPESGLVEPPAITLETTEDRSACADRNPLRNVYFGDLHVHTGLSFDAWIQGTRTGPGDAYRFAKGETIPLPPLDANGNGTRPVRLETPLDFVAVTDHAEYLAEVEACTTPGSPAYETEVCVDYHDDDSSSYVTFGMRLTDPDPERDPTICGEGVVDCPQRARGVWSLIVEAAEDHYDKTEACSFTTFVAYEYSASTNLSNLHRNVIFRNATVPVAPVSYFEEPTPRGLWAALREGCSEAGTGCDVLAIPHNPNWSNGNLFVVEYPGAVTPEEQRAQAEERAAMEPLVEIYQHKGDSECRGGFASVLGAPDELCDFEKLRDASAEDCGEETGSNAMVGAGCVSRWDFVRNALKEGMLEEARIGANPYKLGFIASTDTHAGVPGHVSERDWKGHLGVNDDEPDEMLKTVAITPGGVIDSPGGLAAVWAVENSRDAIFEAMRRKETYGTSGPRIALRFFGGWGWTPALCEDPQMLEKAYAAGVPMGGDLPPAADPVTGPTFLVSALRDPSDLAAPLQRIQIVKSWIGSDGVPREQVFEVAGEPDNGATVNTETCDRSGAGFADLCAVWTDPTFDPAQRATWYARVLENPTCRWSAWWCNAIPAADRPPGCTDDRFPKVIQERAWSSPIWHTAP